MDTIVTTCRRFAGLLSIWVLAMAALAIWPTSPQGQPIPIAVFGPDTHLGVDAIFSHTGLWVSVTDEEGAVAYVREIRRR